MRLRLTKRKIIFLTCCFLFAFLVIISIFYTPSYKIILNPTNSLPKGLYFKVPFDKQKIQYGVIVYFSLDQEIILMLEDRAWFPKNVPLMKWIYALPGDEVFYFRNEVYINGKLFGYRSSADRQGRPLPWVNEGYFHLQENQFFVGSLKIKDSFDSRYFGPIRSKQIIGICYPLLTFKD